MSKPKITTTIISAAPGFELVALRRGEIASGPVIAWKVVMSGDLVINIVPISFAFTSGDPHAIRLPDGRVSSLLSEDNRELIFHPSVDEWWRSVVRAEWNGIGHAVAGMA